jgi:hypothetical protein
MRRLVIGLEAHWADFKTSLQMEMLRNCSPKMALKKLHLRLIGQNLIRVLNVAGPRRSKEPEVLKSIGISRSPRPKSSN